MDRCGYAIIRCMDELWDAVSLDHVKRGYTIRRNDEGFNQLRNNGVYHVVVIGFIITRHHLVLSRRAMGKAASGYYEATGGSVISGETSLQAIIREWKEEIGYEPKDHMVIPMGSYIHDITIYDVFVVFDDDYDFTTVSLQESEVDQIILANINQIDALIQEKKAVDCLIVYRNQINTWLNQ